MGNCIDALARIKLSDSANVDIFDLSGRQSCLLTQRQAYLDDPLRKGRDLTVFEQSVVSRMDAELVVLQGLIDRKTAADARVTKDAVRKTLEAIAKPEEDDLESGPDVLTMSAQLETQRTRARADLVSMFASNPGLGRDLAGDERKPMLSPRGNGSAVVEDAEEDDDDGLTLPQNPRGRVLVPL